ncbi:hypothetical protein QEG73_14315 [Chitinophagaceae bacterium 26-R-25]|nr:hypothetical protein [Chitinophagaceae bacterium 26-R-25]
MTSINDFIKQEEQKMTRLDKWTGNYPKVASTITYATALIQTFPEQAVIKPSWWSKVFTTFWGLFIALIWMLMVITSGPFFPDILSVLLPTALFCVVVYTSFFDKRNVYILKIDKTCIFIDDRKIAWSEIDGTYIMSKKEGKYMNYYLIIFRTDRTVEKLNLSKMATSQSKLSTLVEHYKLQWRAGELTRQTS